MVWQGFQYIPDKDVLEGLGWQLGLLVSPLSREGTRRARRAWTSWGRRLGSSFCYRIIDYVLTLINYSEPREPNW